MAGNVIGMYTCPPRGHSWEWGKSISDMAYIIQRASHGESRLVIFADAPCANEAAAPKANAQPALAWGGEHMAEGGGGGGMGRCLGGCA